MNRGILNDHNTGNCSLAVVASSDIASVVWEREGEETSIAWEAGVQGTSCRSRIPPTHIDEEVAAAAAMTAVLEVRMVAVAAQMKPR